MTLEKTEQYGPDTYRAEAIRPLPDTKGRKRIGDELQPWADYAHIDPLNRIITDVADLKTCEEENSEFYKDEWWGWTHQKLSFVNGKLGLKIILSAIPYAWSLTIILGGLFILAWGFIQLNETWDLPTWPSVLALGLLIFSWIFIAFYIIQKSTNWIMSHGIGFLLKPFEKTLQKKVDESLADGMSEFNRITGQVKFAQGKGRFFEAPFIEFDAYVERVVQRGGIFYRLMFIHRYTGKIFNQTWLSGIEANKNAPLALWDMLQRFMDVSQPIPDMPRFEPFRHLDPVTAEYDQQTNRPPRYWRDLDLEAWKENEGNELAQATAKFPWNQRRCMLTPKLGQIEMAAYRKQRPETAVPI